MALTQTKTPYEFLVRWDDAGVLRGAHISFIERIVDGATVLSSKVGDIMPVSMAGGVGFPLADALAAVNVSAVADGEAKAAQIVQMTADHAAALKVVSDAQTAAEQARDAALAQATELSAKLAALAPVTVNGVPQRVSRRQAIQALILANKLALVQPAINEIADPMQRALMQSEFDDSQFFDRLRPSLISLAKGALGMTDAQIDALFVQAAGL